MAKKTVFSAKIKTSAEGKYDLKIVIKTTMSDILADYKKRQLEWTLKLSTECPPHYVKQQVAQELEFLFCIETLWPLLRLWKELLDSPSVKATYIDFLNSTVVDGWFIIRRDCDRVRVEKLLSKKAYGSKSYLQTNNWEKEETAG